MSSSSESTFSFFGGGGNGTIGTLARDEKKFISPVELFRQSFLSLSCLG